MEIFILFFYKGIEKTVVAWLDKVAVCHSRLRGKVLLRGSENSDLTIFAKRSGVMPWLDSLLYERLNKEVKILSFRGYDHGIQLIIS
ncbi:hypothetical protein [Rickettsia endosymbiont of Ceutorhynchus obstrictus]|uniref:hypothetical protein n=1 Tax=Rickettsia endosymbiont of Ceutorhynchus obstrictus TaxID=3066249 RepID=UPI003132D8CC